MRWEKASEVRVRYRKEREKESWSERETKRREKKLLEILNGHSTSYHNNCAFMHKFTPTDMGVFLFKICKMSTFFPFCTIFIYFISKMLHINASKNVQRCVYLYICYSNCVYLHGYCNSSIYYFSICFSLLSISLSDQLSFSLSSLYLTLTSLSFSHLINHWRRRSLTQASG